MANSRGAGAMPKYETVIVDINSHGLATLILNRPKVRNAFNDQLYSDCAAALDRLAERDDVGAVMITGAGKYFSSGADLQASSDRSAHGGSAKAPVGQFMLAVHRFPKPIAACVNGPAIGIGTTLLPHCDFVYCTRAAYFWTPFARIAVVPEFASTLLFPEIMGVSLGTEMLLMGRKMDVDTALRCGLVSAVLPAEQLVPEVMKRMHAMLAHTHGAKSARLFKRMVKGRRAAEIEAVIVAELAELDKRLASGETAEAAMATIMAMAAAKQKERDAKQRGGGAQVDATSKL